MEFVETRSDRIRLINDVLHVKIINLIKLYIYILGPLRQLTRANHRKSCKRQDTKQDSNQ